MKPLQNIQSYDVSCNNNGTVTPRQAEVLTDVARGLTNKEIAKNLGISPDRVKQIIEALSFKLKAFNRTHLVTQAFANHLLKAVTFMLIATLNIGLANPAQANLIDDNTPEDLSRTQARRNNGNRNGPRTGGARNRGKNTLSILGFDLDLNLNLDCGFDPA